MLTYKTIWLREGCLHLCKIHQNDWNLFELFAAFRNWHLNVTYTHDNLFVNKFLAVNFQLFHDKIMFDRYLLTLASA